MIEGTLDNNGLPTTYLCFRILKIMFREHNQYFSTNDLRALLAAKKNDVERICKDLCRADYILRNQVDLNKYKYNTHCRQDIMQCNFERYLSEVETEVIPIHKHLPYSPSVS